MFCLVDWEKQIERHRLVCRICAWVAVHNMFGCRFLNCEELRKDLNTMPTEILESVIRVLECEEV